MHHLDRLNSKILDQLERNGRISNTELAEKVGLSTSACFRRVKELEKSGVITGYRAQLNRSALGTGITAFVMVGLSDHRAEHAKKFEQAVACAREVREVHNITGATEYLLRVEAKDLAAFKRFHSEVLGTLPQVHSITSHICLDSPKDERA